MNWDQIEGKWKQVTGSAKQKWGRLTDDDLAFINGSKDKFLGRLQARYGLSKEEAQNQVEAWTSTVPARVKDPAAPPAKVLGLLPMDSCHCVTNGRLFPLRRSRCASRLRPWGPKAKPSTKNRTRSNSSSQIRGDAAVQRGPPRRRSSRRPLTLLEAGQPLRLMLSLRAQLTKSHRSVVTLSPA